MAYIDQLNKFYDLLRCLTKNAYRLSEEDVKKITKRTFVKEIYSCWDFSDEGEDLELYIGATDGCATPRYFLKHFCRDWFGGWTSNDTTTWYEISEQEYIELRENNDTP